MNGVTMTLIANFEFREYKKMRLRSDIFVEIEFESGFVYNLRALFFWEC